MSYVFSIGAKVRAQCSAKYLAEQQYGQDLLRIPFFFILNNTFQGLLMTVIAIIDASICICINSVFLY